MQSGKLNMKIVYVFLLTSSLGLLLAPITLAQQRQQSDCIKTCGIALDAEVRDHINSNIDKKTFEKLRKGYCRESASQTSSSSGMGVDVPVKGVQVGFDSSQDRSSQTYEKLCQNYDKTKFDSNKQLLAKSTVVIEAHRNSNATFLGCVKTACKSGPMMNLDAIDDSSNEIIRLKFAYSNSREGNPKFEKLVTTGDVKCTLNSLNENEVIERQVVHTIICKRRLECGEGTVQVVTNSISPTHRFESYDDKLKETREVEGLLQKRIRALGDRKVEVAEYLRKSESQKNEKKVRVNIFSQKCQIRRSTSLEKDGNDLLKKLRTAEDKFQTEEGGKTCAERSRKLDDKVRDVRRFMYDSDIKKYTYECNAEAVRVIK